MKQIIKSAIVYNAELPSAELLEGHLKEHDFCEAMRLQTRAVGFVPREDFGPFIETFPGGIAFTLRIDQKLIPTSVVRAEVDRRAKEIFAQQGRKVGKAERKQLRGEVIDAFAANALIQTTLITAFHHTESNYLIVPTTSAKLAQEVVSQLVHACGSVKTTTINVSSVKQGLTTRMRAWLQGDVENFEGMEPNNVATLESGSYRVTVKMDELDSARAGLTEAFDRGFEVKSLGLEIFDVGTFTLTSDFRLRSISLVTAPIDGVGQEGEDPGFAGQAALDVASIHQIVKQLCTMFEYKEGEAPSDTTANT